jgi:hypothetical protein
LVNFFSVTNSKPLLPNLAKVGRQTNFLLRIIYLANFLCNQFKTSFTKFIKGRSTNQLPPSNYLIDQFSL